jgi:hypothetical protein
VAAKESGTTMSMVRRDGERCAGEDVMVLGEQSHEDAAQKPDCPAIACKTFSGQRFQRHLLSSEMCAQYRRWGCGNSRKQKKKGEVSLAGVPE